MVVITIKKYMISPKSLKMQTYSSLKEAIISGVFKDNEMITEKRAQEEFNISRTPFREAIQMLEVEGWVQSIPYKGTYISPITFKDLEEIFEMRMIVEPEITERVAKKIKINEIERIESIMESMNVDDAQQSEAEFMNVDRDFHKAIYELANNQRLTIMMQQNSDLIRRIGVRILHKKHRREEVVDEHYQILEGLKKGSAKEMMILHLEKAKQTYMQEYREEIGE